MLRLAAATVLALTCSPLFAQALKPTDGYLPRFSRQAERATSQTVDLRIQFPEGVELERWPVTFGVPIPRGALASAENAQLLENGVPAPATLRRTATWEREDGDVKWLLIDATVKRGAEYALQFGTDVTRPEHGDAIRLADNGTTIEIDTGPAVFEVRRDSGALIHRASLPDGAELVPQGASGAPYVIDHSGVRYSLDPADEYKVEVEQAGPRHAVIKCTGWLTDAEGTRLCQQISRLHLYLGFAVARVEHTLVVAFDTDRYQIRDIGLPVAVRQDGIARFGLQNRQSVEVGAGGYVLQDAADHSAVFSGAREQVAEGTRASGWADASGVTVALRHMWQEYPRSLAYDGRRITAHLWSPHQPKVLDFSARGVLGEERYKTWDRVYYSVFYEDGLDQYDQAYGLAKSSELLISLHEGTEADAGAARTIEEPVIVTATPEWMCGSEAMGIIHPEDRERFPQEERKMDLGLERFQLLREHLGNYGFIDYGDVNYNLISDPETNTWQPSPWRRWASRFYGHPVMPWVQFLRTARRDYFDWAVDNARHVMDIDMCHLTNEELSKRTGGRYGGNGGIIHYAADLYDIGCDSHVDQWLLCYYLTGYRRAWDVLLEEADYSMWLDQTSYGHLKRYAHRMTGGTMRTMIALYRATWDARYLEIAQRMAEFCYGAQDAKGVIRHDDVYMLPGMFTYYQATGDERMRELILRCMKRQARVGRDEADPRSFGFYGLSTAYLMTGDPSYLRWAERWRQDFLSSVTDTEDPLFRGQPRGQWDYCYLTLHNLYMPYYLAAVAVLDEPVAPAARDDAVTNGEIVLLRETTEPCNVAVEWSCYDRRYTGGVAVNALSRYVEKHPPQARVVLRGPDRSEVASAAIEFPEGGRSEVVSLEAPEGPTGQYDLRVEGAGKLPYKIRLASSDMTRWGYCTNARRGQFVSLADAYCFFVPGNCARFGLAFKAMALRRDVRFAVLDPESETVREQTITYGSNPQRDYVKWDIEPAPEHRGKLWRFIVDPPHPSIEQVYLDLDGIAPIVWTRPEAYFEPEALPPAAPHEVHRAALPYPGAGPVRSLPAGETVSIPRGQAIEGGGYERINPQRGTIELWCRQSAAPDDIVDHDILRCGQLRAYRRSNIGTYLDLGGHRQSGFACQPGQWHHLAFTWDAGAADRTPDRWMYFDGLKTGSMMGGSKAPLSDWTGEAIVIGSDIPMEIYDFRISGTIRYEADFDPPGKLAADGETLHLGID